MYVCSICQRQLKSKANLAGHMKTVHDKATPKRSHQAKPIPKATQKVKQFEVKVSPVTPSSKLAYKCGACGAALDGEVSPCPSCGAELTWS